MNDNQRKVIIGGLLHDIGKVLYRSDDGRNHSQSGYDFLKNDVDIKDQDILDQIRYHHSQNIKQADLNKDSLAYITYIADNIASGLDRRDKEDGEGGFVRDIALESIFNILNHNKGNEHYRPAMLGKDKEINFPTTDKIQYDESFYRSIYQKIQECLKEFSYDDKYINSLLEILEATLSFVPSSTSQKQMIDISLYDHVKITAAIGSCIYEYMKENKIQGNILNVSSSSSIRPANNSYGLAKWGIRGMTLGLAKHLSADGIVVNAIAPGPTATSMLMGNDEQSISRPASPSGRYTTPEEVANLSVVLVSDLGRMINGDTVYVTGGCGLLTFDDWS